MIIDNSKSLFEKAMALIPGGVNSPVRACQSVDSTPLFIDRAEGCRIFDADGNAYIDYVCSWGPMILGHRHPKVIRAIASVLDRGTSFGAPTDLEVELAQLVVEAVSSIESVRMVNSGTEATMSALRLARGFTGRDGIVKFDGCYHGHGDSLLVSAGSGVATLGIPGSPGVPQSMVSATSSLPFNDIEAFEDLMKKKGETVAAVIVEPVAANMGLVKPKPEFLEALRTWTQKTGSLLIFDEVITGFRLGLGGAQALFNIRPDLTCLGKIIGGGLPVGAYGGRRDIMESIAPKGGVYQAGTLSGNPVAMTAGIATLKELKTPGFYEDLDQKAQTLVQGLKQAVDQSGVPAQVDRMGSILGLFFSDQDMCGFEDVKTCDVNLYTRYYKEMREAGIYLAPSQFEVAFVSSAHGDADIRQTIEAARSALQRLAG